MTGKKLKKYDTNENKNLIIKLLKVDVSKEKFSSNLIYPILLRKIEK